MQRVDNRALRGALLMGGVSLIIGGCQKKAAAGPAPELSTVSQVEEYALRPAVRKPIQRELRLPGEVLLLLCMYG